MNNYANQLNKILLSVGENICFHFQFSLYDLIQKTACDTDEYQLVSSDSLRIHSNSSLADDILSISVLSTI